MYSNREPSAVIAFFSSLRPAASFPCTCDALIAVMIVSFIRPFSTEREGPYRCLIARRFVCAKQEERSCFTSLLLPPSLAVISMLTYAADSLGPTPTRALSGWQWTPLEWPKPISRVSCHAGRCGFAPCSRAPAGSNHPLKNRNLLLL